MSDMAFAAVSKVYAGLSARRFDTDVREAAARGLTVTDPHFNSVLRYLRDPEMTPLLRHLVALSATPLKAVEDGLRGRCDRIQHLPVRPLVRPQVGEGRAGPAHQGRSAVVGGP